MPRRRHIDVPFNLITASGQELKFIGDALSAPSLSGDGKYSARCEAWIESTLKTKKAMLVPSCTAGLEMAALLLDIKPGDEVIMPSFTFVSTANAFVLRGAIPVFVDIDLDSLNIDPRAVADAVTDRTRAIVVVHYAGQACDMSVILAVAKDRGIPVVEDAAQGLLSSYEGRSLGTLGRIGCMSFHTTKNVTCGHGGVVLLNEADDIARAEIIRDRGTNRRRFIEGAVQKYSWVDAGSSFFLSEICSAYLYAQLRRAQPITKRRLKICATYRKALRPLADAGLLHLPSEPQNQHGNGHIFFFLAQNEQVRLQLLEFLKERRIQASFHYTPLHLSPAGQRYGRAHGTLKNTENASARIVRLPLFFSMSSEQVRHVASSVHEFYGD